MTAQQLFNDLLSAGYKFRVEADKLWVQPRPRQEEVIAAIQSYKEELIGLVSQTTKKSDENDIRIAHIIEAQPFGAPRYSTFCCFCGDYEVVEDLREAKMVAEKGCARCLHDGPNIMGTKSIPRSSLDVKTKGKDAEIIMEDRPQRQSA